MAKVLVTGSKGQLGREIQQAAADFPQLSFLYADIDELDITKGDDVREYMELHQPKFIINTAAYTAVDKAEDERDAASLINAVAVGNLVKAAFAVNAYLLHISTDYVFDGKKTTPYVETDTVNPLSVYGQTKLEGEQAVASYNKGMTVRTAWLYSAAGNNFVNTMLRLGAERSELRVVNDQFGSPTYAADLALALLQIVAKLVAQPKTFVPGVYHYTNEGVCTWCDFAKRIMKLGHRSCTVIPCTTAEYPTKAHRPQYSVLSKDKIKQTYGIDIPAWEDGLERCFERLKS